MTPMQRCFMRAYFKNYDARGPAAVGGRWELRRQDARVNCWEAGYIGRTNYGRVHVEGWGGRINRVQSPPRAAVGGKR